MQHIKTLSWRQNLKTSAPLQNLHMRHSLNHLGLLRDDGADQGAEECEDDSKSTWLWLLLCCIILVRAVSFFISFITTFPNLLLLLFSLLRLVWIVLSSVSSVVPPACLGLDWLRVLSSPHTTHTTSAIPSVLIEVD